MPTLWTWHTAEYAVHRSPTPMAMCLCQWSCTGGVHTSLALTSTLSASSSERSQCNAMYAGITCTSSVHCWSFIGRAYMISVIPKKETYANGIQWTSNVFHQNMECTRGYCKWIQCILQDAGSDWIGKHLTLMATASLCWDHQWEAYRNPLLPTTVPIGTRWKPVMFLSLSVFTGSLWKLPWGTLPFKDGRSVSRTFWIFLRIPKTSPQKAPWESTFQVYSISNCPISELDKYLISTHSFIYTFDFAARFGGWNGVPGNPVSPCISPTPDVFEK